jgi:hypothetical protein
VLHIPAGKHLKRVRSVRILIARNVKFTVLQKTILILNHSLKQFYRKMHLIISNRVLKNRKLSSKGHPLASPERRSFLDYPRPRYYDKNVSCAKAGSVDHIRPAIKQQPYLSKLQGFSSGYVWSLHSGEKWSSAPAFLP